MERDYYNREEINWFTILMAAKNGNLAPYYGYMAYNFPKVALIMVATAGVSLPQIVATEVNRH